MLFREESVFLLQAQGPADREEFERLANAPRPRLRPPSHVNPDHEVTPVSCRQRLKEFPGSGLCLECGGDVSGERRYLRFWRISVCRGSRREARYFEEAGRPEFIPAFPVRIRPLARRLPRRDFDRI